LDTTQIDSSAAPLYRLDNVGGTFAEGSYSATLTATQHIIGNADPSFLRMNLFNSTIDNGVGFNDPSLAGYALNTSFGPVTVNAPGTPTSFLTPTFNGTGDGFSTTGGDTIEFTALTSLTFQASVVPEPSTWATMILGFVALGLMAHRRSKSTLATA